jgi:putative inorganic carbon (HCO3(-)) transporter
MNSQDFTEGARSTEVVSNTDSASHTSTSSTPVFDDSSSKQGWEVSESTASQTPHNPPPDRVGLLTSLSPFWHDRLIEAGLILSMALYYFTGNQHLGTSHFFHLNPLYSLPFLLIFAVLCWYRLSFAVALLPLTLPYYLLQKTVIGSYAFSMAEITLAVCLLVALLRLLIQRRKWQYWLSWQELRLRLGPFVIPILVFLAAVVLSTVIAYNRQFALRAARKEVLDPLLYLLLALYCLRTRQDLIRLLAALLGTGLVVALISIAQYLFFRHYLVVEAGNVLRVHAAYGSANDIGLLFDYIVPIALALVVARLPKMIGVLNPWQFRALVIGLCLPLLLVLYLSQSHGAWLAIAASALFIVALTIRNRKVLLVSSVIFLIIAGFGILVFHTRIIDFLLEGHVNSQGISTAMKRLYLWRSAWNMIQGSPWLGYGMDNWLCHYSNNPLCHTHLFHYIIKNDPVTGASTGLQEEPLLSHPHNILLHVWVSMGLFGLLAFIAILGLFIWLFARILIHLRASEVESNLYLQWLTIGVVAAMVAAFLHGQVDSSFLEQDLSFCFWTLVAALLLLRVHTGTSWRKEKRQALPISQKVSSSIES